MVNLLDFFSRDRGVQRTQRLRDLLNYYIPPDTRDPLAALAGFTPSASLAEGGAGFKEALSPSASVSQRVAGVGKGLTGTAGVAAPMIVANKAGLTAAEAIQDSLLGFSQGANYAGQKVLERANQRGPMPTVYSNPVVPNLSSKSGITAYHGSPYDFDRFSMDAIGTGEGAQAYGHGLYFTESEPIAQHYRQKLSAVNSTPLEEVLMTMDGSPADQARFDNDVRQAVSFASTSNSAEVAARDFAAFTGRDVTPDLVDAFERAMVEKGRMYEVNIKANPEDFLDWDKTGPEQSEGVRKALTSIANKDPQVMQAFKDAMQRGDKGAIYESLLQDRLGDIRLNQEAAARRLQEAGISGIKYFDAMSRNAGEGSRNYVVFDDKMIDIVRKYGIAGAAALLGISTADVQGALAQEQGAQPQRGLLD
jgi:hypothetical protein